MKYRKKPVVIEALQWTGTNFEEIKAFVGKDLEYSILDTAWEVGKGAPHVFMKIHTLEGDHECAVGGYIIKGANGEFCPCKPDIFGKTYDVLSEEEKITPKISIESDGITAMIYLNGEKIRSPLIDFSFHGDVENGIHIKWDGVIYNLDENGMTLIENNEIVTEKFHYDSHEAVAN